MGMGPGDGLALAQLSCRLLDPSLGLKVMILGQAGADPEQLRRLVPDVDPVQTFFATDDGPSLERAVSSLATSLCQIGSTTQVCKGPPGEGLLAGERGPGDLGRRTRPPGDLISTATARTLHSALSKGKCPGLRGWARATPGAGPSDPHWTYLSPGPEGATWREGE